MRNIPLSLGVPALSIGAGGEGGGAHTQGEWYSAKDRETGLRRVLLLTLAMLDGHRNNRARQPLRLLHSAHAFLRRGLRCDSAGVSLCPAQTMLQVRLGARGFST